MNLTGSFCLMLGVKIDPAPVWYLGDTSLLSMPLASVIGSREITSQGILRTKRITKMLIDAGFCVVSGLAKGVDTVAHETSLSSGGKTIAVLGTPIDKCYPAENSELKSRIEENGLVISQFPIGSKVFQSNFPKRNVTMAALSQFTIVIEASEKSGTRHQVKAATNFGRKVGFLESVVDHRFSWVDDAISTGFGFVISEPEDLRTFLAASMNSNLDRSSSSAQGELFHPKKK